MGKHILMIASLIGFSLGCGNAELEKTVSQNKQVIADLKEQLNKEVESAKALELRLTTVEDSIKGIGYTSLGYRTSTKWYNPKIFCKGAKDTPRDFSTAPAQLCVRSGWRSRKRPSSMVIKIRAMDDQIIFDKAVDFQKDKSAYCTEVPKHSCDQIFSLGLNLTPPTKEKFSTE